MAPNTKEILKTQLGEGFELVAATDAQPKSGNLRAVYFYLNESPVTAEVATALLLMRSSAVIQGA